MARGTQRLFLLPVVLVALLSLLSGNDAAPRSPRSNIVGGFAPISDPQSAAIRALAEFAVTQHRKDTGERLTLSRVLGGQQQVVNGMNCRLVIGAKGTDNVERHYLAVVYEGVRDNVRELKGFDLVV